MNESNGKQSSNRKMKSSVFTTYFSDPENAAQLYSALDGVLVEPWIGFGGGGYLPK